MRTPDHSEQPTQSPRISAHEPASEEAMRIAVDTAVRNVAGADAAALSIAQRGGQVATPVATHESARWADELQYAAGAGPCLSAIWEQPQVVLVPDLTAESRWPSWVEAMSRESGFRSMLILRLSTASQRVGSLNLYSTKPNGFDHHDERNALALAAHIAISVSTALEAESLRAALDTRTVIGQAQGLAMERYGLDAAGAFALLTRLSSHSNRKLRDVAQELVETRHLPLV